jgi:hypothetical protein
MLFVVPLLWSAAQRTSQQQTLERDDYLYLALKQTDSPTNRGVQFAFKISKSHVVRISNELSHFATFFLAWQAEVSIVISCVCFMFQFRDLTIVFFKVLKVIDVRLCSFNMLDDERCATDNNNHHDSLFFCLDNNECYQHLFLLKLGMFPKEE